ncbi:MAG: hypothetical protein ACO37F_07990 [Pirellulales bacterium]
MRLGPGKPAPALPPDIVAATREKYLEVCRRLTGSLPEGIAS